MENSYITYNEIQLNLLTLGTELYIKLKIKKDEVH